MGDWTKLGPTGKFPNGKLNPHDEGGLTTAIATDEHGNVHINFGAPVMWIAMPAALAREFANSILTKALEADRRKKPVVVEGPKQ